MKKTPANSTKMSNFIFRVNHKQSNQIRHSFLFLFSACFALIKQSTPNADFLQFFNQFSVLMHLKEDVTSADELPIDKHLRDCWPICEV